MARRTVRVDVPTKKPEDFSKLLNDIKKQHTLLGDDSPLKDDPDIDMTTFIANLTQADGLRSESESLRNQSENKMQQARTLYGTSTGQSINTPGTLLFACDTIKRALLKKYKGNEEMLSTFGFNVVVGQASSPKSKVK